MKTLGVIVSLFLLGSLAPPAIAEPLQDAGVLVVDSPSDVVAPAATATRPEPSPEAAPDSTAPAALPHPVDAPQESVSLVVQLYKAGHLVPLLVVVLFFGLTLAQRWIDWLRLGWRKLAVASALAGLTMLAERAASGTTPNLMMLMGAFGVSFSMWMNGRGDPKPAPSA